MFFCGIGSCGGGGGYSQKIWRERACPGDPRDLLCTTNVIKAHWLCAQFCVIQCCCNPLIYIRFRVKMRPLMMHGHERSITQIKYNRWPCSRFHHWLAHCSGKETSSSPRPRITIPMSGKACLVPQYYVIGIFLFDVVEKSGTSNWTLNNVLDKWHRNAFYNNLSSPSGILSMVRGWELLRDIRELSGSYKDSWK